MVLPVTFGTMHRLTTFFVLVLVGVVPPPLLVPPAPVAVPPAVVVPPPPVVPPTGGGGVGSGGGSPIAKYCAAMVAIVPPASCARPETPRTLPLSAMPVTLAAPSGIAVVV